jgi:hypothetical protein
MVIAVPEKFARSVGREPKTIYLKGSIYRQLIPVPKIVNPVHPAKLEPVPICQQEACARTMTSCPLNDDPVFALRLIVLSRLQVFVSSAQNHEVLVLVIYVALMSSGDPLHPVIYQDANIPLDVRKVFAVLQLTKYLQSSLRPQLKRRTHLGPDFSFRRGCLRSPNAGGDQQENEKENNSCPPGFHLVPPIRARRLPTLTPQMVYRVAHWLTGDLNYAVEGLVEFKNQKNCSGHGERYYDHGDNHRPV